jgi:hypothetical protein
MPLYAVDGSALELPYTEALGQLCGRASSGRSEKLCVMARIFLMYDILNDVCINGFLHPLNVSEETALFQCLTNSSDLSLENRLLTFDRNYPSHWLMYILMRKKAKFAIRLPRNANRTAENFIKSPEDDLIVKWKPSPASVKRLREAGYERDVNESLRIRLVKVTPSADETEIPAANLYNREKYTKEDLKEAYGLRRVIETDCGHLKEKLQPVQFSGIRQVCVKQDFAAALLFYNIQSMVAKPAMSRVKETAQNRKHECKINKNVSFGSLKDRVVLLILRNDSRITLIEPEVLFGRSPVPVIRGRKVPRNRPRAQRQTSNVPELQKSDIKRCLRMLPCATARTLFCGRA